LRSSSLVLNRADTMPDRMVQQGGQNSLSCLADD
jgi:hypothetical protein